MANRVFTVFQNLDKAITGNWDAAQAQHSNTYDMSSLGNEVIYKAKDKEDYLKTKLELQQNSFLNARWRKANVDLTVQAFNGLNNIKLMYRDAELMDSFPEIGAALDIVAEESCLHGDTKIKLLDGRIKTIKELYDNKEKDFWVYAIDNDGEIKPSHVDGVIHKGKKQIYEIILDDGTIIKCTDDHMWLKSDNEWVMTCKLRSGDSMMSIYSTIDEKGYEKVMPTNGTLKHTHRIVAEAIHHDRKIELSKNNINNELIVIHHASFDKLNNNPDKLVYMLWSEHQALHTSLNSARWNDKKFSEKMRSIFSKTAKKLWSDEKKAKQIKERLSEVQKKRISKFSSEELKEYFGRRGKHNGMYGVHRYGKKNPNFNHDKNHIDDINFSEYCKFIFTLDGKNPNKLIKNHFNLLPRDIRKLNKQVCEIYNVKDLTCLISLFKGLKLKEIANNLDNKKIPLTYDELANASGFKKSTIKHLNQKFKLFNIVKIAPIVEQYDKDELCEKLLCSRTDNYLNIISNIFNCNTNKAKKISRQVCDYLNINTIKGLKYSYKSGERISQLKKIYLSNPSVNAETAAKNVGLSKNEFLNFVKLNGYKNIIDFKKSLTNHRVVSIKQLEIQEDVYDLANSSVNNSFGVVCNNGMVISHNCVLSEKGQIVNVYSKSDRVKSILEDLFTNRLDLQITAPMIVRAMCKYGNQFMLLNVDNKMGITGWRQLPVYNVERLENGIENPYSAVGFMNATKSDNDKDMSTKFMWVDAQNSSQVPFRNWQIGHFRLLTNSLYLPYGVSYLNNARRHWRMLSLMEDMMLIYRLERSIERRVYKIFVGAIDDADVKAYVEDIANNFKRTPIIDPETGQVDLRKNLLDVSQDLFIPVRDPNAPTPIDTLSAAQNLTAMDDIKFVQNKVLTALRIPKTFLNFEEAAGEGKNLALMDIRFTRTINRIQQAFLMELTKIASIHLYLLGFDDELTNFSLSMNNPSTQAEQLQIDNIQKKISAIRDAVADPGNGLPIMSQTRALKEIMKWSDKDIQENLEEIRLEKAIAAELEKTTQIIKKTRIFDTVDKMYGEPGAEYQDEQQQDQSDGMDGGAMGGGGGMPPMDDLGGGDPSAEVDELGMPGGEEEGDISGAEGEVPMGGNDQTPMESSYKNKPLITEATSKKMDKFSKRNEVKIERAKIYDDTLLINEEFDRMIKSLDEFKIE